MDYNPEELLAIINEPFYVEPANIEQCEPWENDETRVDLPPLESRGGELPF